MGVQELLIILVIVVLLFGAAKIPALGRSLGEGLSNFKRGLKDGEDGPTPRSEDAALPPASRTPAPDDTKRAAAPVENTTERRDG